MTYIYAPDRRTLDAWGTNKYTDFRVESELRWKHFEISSPVEKFFRYTQHYEVPDTFVVLKGLPIL